MKDEGIEKYYEFLYVHGRAVKSNVGIFHIDRKYGPIGQLDLLDQV